MDNKQRARVIITEVLNLALNRHVHVLSSAGYLRGRSHDKDYGFEDGHPKPALKMKHDLIDEMCKAV
jgi:hypothetical protein